MSCILPRIFRSFSLKHPSYNITRCLQVQSVINTPTLLSHIPSDNLWIHRQNDAIKFPITRPNIIQLPNGLRYVPPLVDPVCEDRNIEAPSTEISNISKEATRMLIIRRKKMKKHKLKKLRKRMKYEWAKLRQKREMRKEKAFQATLIQQCKEAEAFSAETYVQQRIEKLNEMIIPRYWKGKRLPEWLIREKMGLPPK